MMAIYNSSQSDAQRGVEISGYVVQVLLKPEPVTYRRWAVIKDKCLYLYDSPSDRQSKTSIILPGCEIAPVSWSSNSGSSQVFIQINDMNKTLYYISPENTGDFPVWLRELTTGSKSQSLKQSFTSDENERPLVVHQVLQESGYMPLQRQQPLTRPRQARLQSRPTLATVAEDVSLPPQSQRASIQLEDIRRKYPVSGLAKRMSVCASDLLGKSHDELVLYLIQLNREEANLKERRAYFLNEIEKWKSQRGGPPMEYLQAELVEIENELVLHRPLISIIDNMVKMGSLYGGDDLMFASEYKRDLVPPSDVTPLKANIHFMRHMQEREVARELKTQQEIDAGMFGQSSARRRNPRDSLVSNNWAEGPHQAAPEVLQFRARLETELAEMERTYRQIMKDQEQQKNNRKTQDVENVEKPRRVGDGTRRSPEDAMVNGHNRHFPRRSTKRHKHPDLPRQISVTGGATTMSPGLVVTSARSRSVEKGRSHTLVSQSERQPVQQVPSVWSDHSSRSLSNRARSEERKHSIPESSTPLRTSNRLNSEEMPIAWQRTVSPLWDQVGNPHQRPDPNLMNKESPTRRQVPPSARTLPTAPSWLQTVSQQDVRNSVERSSLSSSDRPPIFSLRPRSSMPHQSELRLVFRHSLRGNEGDTPAEENRLDRDLATRKAVSLKTPRRAFYSTSTLPESTTNGHSEVNRSDYNDTDDGEDPKTRQLRRLVAKQSLHNLSPWEMVTLGMVANGGGVTSSQSSSNSGIRRQSATISPVTKEALEDERQYREDILKQRQSLAQEAVEKFQAMAARRREEARQRMAARLSQRQ